MRYNYREGAINEAIHALPPDLMPPFAGKFWNNYPWGDDQYLLGVDDRGRVLFLWDPTRVGEAFRATADQTERIRSLIESHISEPTSETLSDISAHLNGLRSPPVYLIPAPTMRFPI